MAVFAIRASVSITCCQIGSNALVNHCLKLGISDRCGVGFMVWCCSGFGAFLERYLNVVICKEGNALVKA
ncbi:hypothetical protein Tco_1376697 [Tanacetum coccineum]